MAQAREWTFTLAEEKLKEEDTLTKINRTTVKTKTYIDYFDRPPTNPHVCLPFQKTSFSPVRSLRFSPTRSSVTSTTSHNKEPAFNDRRERRPPLPYDHTNTANSTNNPLPELLERQNQLKEMLSVQQQQNFLPQLPLPSFKGDPTEYHRLYVHSRHVSKEASNQVKPVCNTLNNILRENQKS